MITISRRIARMLLNVMGRGLATTPRGTAPSVFFSATPAQITVRAFHDNTVITYQQSTEGSVGELGMPLSFLRKFAASNDHPVQLQLIDESTVGTAWEHKSFPQEAAVDLVAMPDGAFFPPPPAEFVENPPRLITALRDASDTADSCPSRYALSQIQLRGQRGEIASTDGRQLLLERGFNFPWSNDLRIERNCVFACAELHAAGPVKIGADDNWVTIAVDPWLLQFRIQTEGRFPKVDDCVPASATAAASWRMSAREADRLNQCLRLLPGDDDPSAPVTVDLNGHACIRARGPKTLQIRELHLTDHAPQGEPQQVAVDRRYLERVGRLGLENLHVFGPTRPLLARDERRSYVWMPLAPEMIVRPSFATLPEHTRRPA